MQVRSSDACRWLLICPHAATIFSFLFSPRSRMQVQLNDEKSARGRRLTLQLYSFPSARISEVLSFLRSKGVR